MMRGFTLGRIIDFRYKTNRNMSIISMLLFLGGAWWFSSFSLGAQLGFGFFLCWALAREIDPEHDLSAFVAGFIYLGVVFILDGFDFGVLFLLLLLLRLITKICGQVPSNLDIAGIAGLSFYLVLSQRNGVFLLLPAMAFWMAYSRYDKDKRMAFMGILFVGSFLGSFLFYPLTLVDASVLFSLAGWKAILSVLMLSWLAYLTQFDEQIQDDLGKRLEAGYVQQGICFLIGSLVLLFVVASLYQATWWLILSLGSGILLYRLLG